MTLRGKIPALVLTDKKLDSFPRNWDHLGGNDNVTNEGQKITCFILCLKAEGFWLLVWTFVKKKKKGSKA